MHGDFICASCRCHLFLKQVHRGRIASAIGARYVSTSSPPCEQKPRQTLDRRFGEGQYVEPTPRVRGRQDGIGEEDFRTRHNGQIPHNEPLRSIEDDFLERIMTGKEPSAGPYSQLRQRLKHRQEAEPQRSNAPVSAGKYGEGKTTTYRYQPLQKKGGARNTPNALSALHLLPSSVLPTGHKHSRDPMAASTSGAANFSPSLDDTQTSSKEETHLNKRTPDTLVRLRHRSKISSAFPSVSSELSRALSGRSVRPNESTESGTDLKPPSIWTHVETIKSLEASPNASWEAFLNLSRLASLDILKRDATCRDALINKMVNGWSKQQSGGVQLTPSLVLQRFDRLGFAFKPLHWSSSLSYIHSAILKEMTQNTEVESSPELPALFQEMLSMWNYFLSRYAFSRPKRTYSTTSKPKPTTWAQLMQSKKMGEIRAWSSKDFKHQLYHFFDVTSQTHPNLDFQALTTLGVLRYAREKSINLRNAMTYEPFIEFVTKVLSYSNVENRYSELQAWINADALPAIPKHEIETVIWTLQTLVFPATASKAAVSVDARSTIKEEKEGQPWLNQLSSLEELYKKRIGRSIEKGDARQLMRLLQEAREAFGEAAMVPNLYLHFLHALMTLRRPGVAIDLWNDMLRNGITPNVQMWDAMLRGFGSMKDSRGVEQIWQMLVDASVQPDAHLWASRIQALANSGRWRLAIRHFEDMVQQWLKAAKSEHSSAASSELASIGDCRGQPKPTPEVINGLIPGLVRARRYDELNSLFALTSAIGVELSAYSFNPLLRQALQGQNYSLVEDLFDQMQKRGVQPDVATFTILMQSLFVQPQTNVSADETPAGLVDLTAKREAAAHLLETMEENGVQANAWTFSTLIDGLLKSDDPGGAQSNLEAANSVILFMKQKNIELNSTIYTSLLMYHFNQEPPNLLAIDEIWQNVQADGSVNPDNVFFDRLIEGLAECRQIERMKTALEQADKRAKAPGWIALTKAVKSLAAAGDLAAVENLVAQVRADLDSNDVFRAQTGRGWFVMTLNELGLDSTGISSHDRRLRSSSKMS